jgi:bifunctional DNA-binding transcriptional regulator/antitoxin component of YhaV-PrlF toxin-antitoxin module
MMEHIRIIKVTTSGQISLPARVRNRWRVSRVVVQDEGDRVLLRPLPDDPIAAACGSLGRRGPAAEAVRRRERRSAAARERRRIAR